MAGPAPGMFWFIVIWTKVDLELGDTYTKLNAQQRNLKNGRQEISGSGPDYLAEATAEVC